MTTLASPPPSSSHNHTIGELEPDKVWKDTLRANIEDVLSSMVRHAKKNYQTELSKETMSDARREAINRKYAEAMDNIRTLARDTFVVELERERLERRWAAGVRMVPGWNDLVQEPQDIMDRIKGTRKGTQSPSVAERSLAEWPDDRPVGDLSSSPSGYSVSPSAQSGPSRHPVQERQERSLDRLEQGIRTSQSLQPPPVSPITPELQRQQEEKAHRIMERKEPEWMEWGRQGKTDQELRKEKEEAKERLKEQAQHLDDRPLRGRRHPNNRPSDYSSYNQGQHEIEDTEHTPQSRQQYEFWLPKSAPHFGPHPEPKRPAAEVETDDETWHREEFLRSQKEEVRKAREEVAELADEICMQLEEASRKEEEVRRKEEEVQRKAETVGLREEEVKRKEVVAREEARRVREENWKQEQELKFREEELKQKSEELQRREREVEADMSQKEEESLKKAERILKQFEKEEERRQLAEQRKLEERFQLEKQLEELLRKQQEIHQWERIVIEKIGQATQREEVVGWKEREFVRREREIRQREVEWRRDTAAKERYLQSKEDEVMAREDAIKAKEAKLEIIRKVAIRCVLVDTRYRRLLSHCVGNDAQTILDVFQSLLDSGTFPDRGKLTVAMQGLSTRTQLYPRRYVLSGPVESIYFPVDSGRFANIFKAEFQGKPICLKVLKAHGNLVGQLAKVYAREAILWGQLCHPNVLPFYGLRSLSCSQIAFVAPWAENGNLSMYLLGKPMANRILLCMDISAGLDYLHTNDIVHGDLKAVNVLVDKSGRACLSDFGLSGITDESIVKWATESSRKSKGGTARWQAPEIHDPELNILHNTKESDIFAWASTCYEIFTGNPPYFEVPHETRVAIKILRGDIPTRPPAEDPAWSERGLTEEIWQLLVDCWRMKPVERPRIKTVINRLNLQGPNNDMRPLPRWDTGVQFRNAQETTCPGTRTSIEALDSILLRILSDSSDFRCEIDPEGLL